MASGLQLGMDRTRLISFAWECIHARGIGRRQVSRCCQWSTPQEVFPEHVGERVTRADEIHLAVPRKANTLSWPVKKMNERPTL